MFSIPTSPFHRLSSGDLTQFIQRPLFLEFWLVSASVHLTICNRFFFFRDHLVGLLVDHAVIQSVSVSVSPTIH